jgi:hypothetical protein
MFLLGGIGALLEALFRVAVLGVDTIISFFIFLFMYLINLMH